MLRLAWPSAVCVLLFTSAAGAQTPPPTPGPAVTTQDDGTLRLRLPTIIVTPQKEPENILDAPVSVTAVTGETIENAGVRSVTEAAQYAPNTFFTDFTARKLSNARFRGIGSSPNNPSVTTYIDGVPQLNANSSSIELVGVSQIEFVRGPQSALFGRNTLGGLINITSSRPSLQNWTGNFESPLGNFSARDVRGAATGPLVADKLALGVAMGYSARDGYTTNDVTGHNLDSRSATFGKLQLLWTPASNWEVRGILTGERARDGDYALNDLAALRANPLHASRDFEGFTERDVVAPTFLITHSGRRVDVSSITGFVFWNTKDLTDLDYTPLSLIKRDNHEKDRQFTQELRVASSRNSALLLSPAVTLRWQAGASLFTQNYTQDAVNSFSPGVLYQPGSFGGGFPPSFSPANDRHSPQSSLDDAGVGVYGQTTVTIRQTFDLIAGVRGDYERKTADLKTFFVTPDPFLGPGTTLNPERTFRDVSPQFIAAYHIAPGRIVYGSASRGFKAGGFNPASPTGSEAYGEEHTWNYEGGFKSSWLGQRLAFNGAVFYLKWDDLQVNLPIPQAPGEFYIANAGNATSKGFELELNARPMPGFDLFGGVGYTNARFGAGSVSGGANVDGKKLSNTPTYTANAGVQYSWAISAAATLYGRAELVSYGDYQYDDANTAGQDAYSLTHLRGGVRGKSLFGEAWVRNAFDTRYVPTAFVYPGLAPSGFIGESGAPRTFGVRVGLTF